MPTFLLAGSSAAAAMLRPVGDANAWLRGTLHEVPLLPFPLSDGLLPGEGLQIHLWERSQISLFEAASQLHGCLGQLLERPGADTERDGLPYAAVAPLLELREHRSCAQGVWAAFTCVGAVRLSGVELRTAAEQRELHAPRDDEAPVAADDESFLVAQAAALREERSSVDYDSADDEEAYLALEVARLHEEVPSLRFDTPPGELGLGEGWRGFAGVARLQGS